MFNFVANSTVIRPLSEDLSLRRHTVYQPLVESQDYHNSTEHYNIILSPNSASTFSDDYLNSSNSDNSVI
jgi:hypothetical protein